MDPEKREEYLAKMNRFMSVRHYRKYNPEKILPAMHKPHEEQ